MQTHTASSRTATGVAGGYLQHARLPAVARTVVLSADGRSKHDQVPGVLSITFARAKVSDEVVVCLCVLPFRESVPQCGLALSGLLRVLQLDLRCTQGANS